MEVINAGEAMTRATPSRGRKIRRRSQGLGSERTGKTLGGLGIFLLRRWRMRP